MGVSPMKTEHGGEQVGRSFPGRIVFRVSCILSFGGMVMVVAAVVRRAMVGTDVAAAAILGGMLVGVMGIVTL